MLEGDSLGKNLSSLRHVGEIEDSDGVGRAGSLVCGAILRFTLEVDEGQRVTEARFKAAACSHVVGACSLLIEAIKGKTTAEAATIARTWSLSNDHFPPEKQHCSHVANEALLNAVRNYSDSIRAAWSGSETLICTCFGVSESTIEQEVRSGGLTTVEEVSLACNAGRGCGSCTGLIQDILDDER